MQPARILLAVIMIGLLSGCASMTVDSYHSPTVNFAELKTYDWCPCPEGKGTDPRIDAEFLESLVRTEVDSQLPAAGYPVATNSAPSFLVRYHLALEDKLDVRVIDGMYGYGPSYRHGYPAWGWPALSRETYVDQYEQGSLVLDFVDPTGSNLIWRGSASTRIQNKGPSQSAERVREAVRLILQRFPPG